MAFFQKFLQKISDDDSSKVSKEYIHDQCFVHASQHAFKCTLTSLLILIISPWSDIQWLLLYVLSQGFKGAPTETAYFGTVKADPNFNAQNDAAKLKKAIETKGKHTQSW